MNTLRGVHTATQTRHSRPHSQHVCHILPIRASKNATDEPQIQEERLSVLQINLSLFVCEECVCKCVCECVYACVCEHMCIHVCSVVCDVVCVCMLVMWVCTWVGGYACQWVSGVLCLKQDQLTSLDCALVTWLFAAGQLVSETHTH